jgi:hypothetical protein
VWGRLTSSTADTEAVECLPKTGLTNCRILVRLGENLTEKQSSGRNVVAERERSCKLYQKTGAWSRTAGNMLCAVEDGKFLRANPRVPQDCATISLHTTILVHKSDPTYRRRVSWFWNHPALPVKGIALVEYSGREPEKILAHGNNLNDNDPYLRTHPQVLDKVQAADRCVSDKGLYDRLTSTDASDVPRNTRQISDARYRTKNRAGPKLPPGSSIADDYAAAYAMMADEQIIHKYVHIQGREPWIVLMLPEQVRLIRTLCTSLGAAADITPIALDRTFNLAPCYTSPLRCSRPAV